MHFLINPMEERNAVELLADYPKEKGIPFFTHQHERHFALFPRDPYTNRKYLFFSTGNLLFLAYDYYSTKMSSTQTFSGVYAISGLEDSIEFEVKKKDWIDFIIRNKVKFGVSYLDINLTCSSIQKFNPANYLSKNQVEDFLKLSAQIQAIRLFSRRDYLPFPEEMKGKTIIGLETNQWLYKKEDVDALIQAGEKILTKLIINSLHSKETQA